MCIHCEMISTLKLIDISITLLSYFFFFMMKHLKSTLSKFQVCSTVLLAIFLESSCLAEWLWFKVWCCILSITAFLTMLFGGYQHGLGGRLPKFSLWFYHFPVLRSCTHVFSLWVCFSHLNMKVIVVQLCLTLCDPMDSTVHGIL